MSQYLLFAADIAVIIAILAFLILHTVNCCKGLRPIIKSIFVIVVAVFCVLFGYYNIFQVARDMWKGIDQADIYFVVPLHLLVLAVIVMLWHGAKNMQQAIDEINNTKA